MKTKLCKDFVLAILTLVLMLFCINANSQNNEKKSLKYNSFDYETIRFPDKKIENIIQYRDNIVGLARLEGKKLKKFYELLKFENNEWIPILPDLNLPASSNPSIAFVNDTLFVAYNNSSYDQPYIKKLVNNSWVQVGIFKPDFKTRDPRDIILKSDNEELYLLFTASFTPYVFKLIDNNWVQIGTVTISVHLQEAKGRIILRTQAMPVALVISLNLFLADEVTLALILLVATQVFNNAGRQSVGKMLKPMLVV